METETNKNLIRPKFETKYLEEERPEQKRTLLALSLNDNEKETLLSLKAELQQERDATLVKQLSLIGYAFVTNTNPQGLLATFVKDNMRRNKRWGLVEVEGKK